MITAQVGRLTRRLKQASIANFIMPRLEDILFIAIFMSVIGLGPRLLNMDGDLGRHLTIGNYILDTLTIPTRDIFSHTMQGLPLTPHEWMAQLIFALSFRLAGMDGVVILCALLIATTFTLVFRQCFQQSNMLLISLGMTILAAAAASLHWLARPHLYTMLFTILWIGELENLRITSTFRWWVLPLLMLVWVNFHGAFIVGFVIWGIYLLDNLFSSQDSFQNSGDEKNNILNLSGIRQKRKLMYVGVLALCLTLVNPVGWRIWETTLGFLRSRYLVGHTVEYLPPNFQQISSWPFLMMIILSMLLIGFSRRRNSIAAILLLSAWTAFGLLSARNIPLYAVISAPIIAGVGASILRDNEAYTRTINFDLRLRLVDADLFGYIWPLISVLLIGVILIGGTNLDLRRTGNKFSEEIFPVEATDWVIDQPEVGPVFNYFPWGGYLLHRLWPQEQVFIDGQTDFYGEPLTRQYEQVITLRDGWREILKLYKIRWVIMPADSRLALALGGEPGWEERYQDGTAKVFYQLP